MHFLEKRVIDGAELLADRTDVFGPQKALAANRA